MMKFIPCALLATLLCLGTTSGIAAPPDFSQSKQDFRSSHPNKEEFRRGENERRGHDRGQERMHKASIERGTFNNEMPLRTGSPISSYSRSKPQPIDYRQYAQLSAPSRYQQWIKVDHNFILINVMTNTVLKVIPE